MSQRDRNATPMRSARGAPPCAFLRAASSFQLLRLFFLQLRFECRRRWSQPAQAFVVHYITLLLCYIGLPVFIAWIRNGQAFRASPADQKTATPQPPDRSSG